jgi:DNA-binding PadR family transcriptional regulator
MLAPFDIQGFSKALLETLVLASVQEQPRHGYQIALDLERRSGGLFALTHGTLYPILHRLEAAGALRGTWSKEGGRRTKAYALTSAGRVKLDSDANHFETVLENVLRVVSNGQSADTHPNRRRRA